ncbi:hypothetical protein [Ekhidna sp. To15]|uniref:hypothetical protein n=1 Tax=Ekhidna sp. To15 TaxID=3395267 RepID=UPI003F527CDC
MKPSDIQREVELTLNSLDRLRKAKAPVDFTDSLTAKMIFSEDQVRWVNRAKLALVAMVAMAILNGIVMFKSQVNQRDQMLDSLAQQYHLIGDL